MIMIIIIIPLGLLVLSSWYKYYMFHHLLGLSYHEIFMDIGLDSSLNLSHHHFHPIASFLVFKIESNCYQCYLILFHLTGSLNCWLVKVNQTIQSDSIHVFQRHQNWLSSMIEIHESLDNVFIVFGWWKKKQQQLIENSDWLWIQIESEGIMKTINIIMS